MKKPVIKKKNKQFTLIKLDGVWIMLSDEDFEFNELIYGFDMLTHAGRIQIKKKQDYLKVVASKEPIDGFPQIPILHFGPGDTSGLEGCSILKCDEEGLKNSDWVYTPDEVNGHKHNVFQYSARVNYEGAKFYKLW